MNPVVAVEAGHTCLDPIGCLVSFHAEKTLFILLPNKSEATLHLHFVGNNMTTATMIVPS